MLTQEAPRCFDYPHDTDSVRGHIETNIVVDQLLFVGIQSFALPNLTNASALVVECDGKGAVFAVTLFEFDGCDARGAFVDFVIESQTHLSGEGGKADFGRAAWVEERR